MIFNENGQISNKNNLKKNEKLENFINKKISEIVPNYQKLEIEITVSKSTYSITFFVTVNGSRMQCYEMVDNNMIKENELNKIYKEIANFIRRESDYDETKINKISFTIKK